MWKRWWIYLGRFARHALRTKKENLYAHKEIDGSRDAALIASLARKVMRPDFVSAGNDFRTINLEQVQPHRRGRQSDVWFRLPEGLRIPSAHHFFIGSL